MGYNVGPTLHVSGETEYTAAMKRVKDSMAYVKAEAAAATSVFAKNDRSIEALTTKNESLKKSLDVQKDAITAAEDALRRMTDQGINPSSDAYKRMEANLNNAKAVMNQTETEINSNEQEIRDCTTALDGMSAAEVQTFNQARKMGKA